MTVINSHFKILSEFTTKPDRIFKSFGKPPKGRRRDSAEKAVHVRLSGKRSGSRAIRRSPLAFRVDAIDSLMFGDSEH